MSIWSMWTQMVTRMSNRMSGYVVTEHEPSRTLFIGDCLATFVQRPTHDSIKSGRIRKTDAIITLSFLSFAFSMSQSMHWFSVP